MIRTILVPLDGSEFSEQALPVAMAIARRAGGHVRLARVHEPPANVERWPGDAPDAERRAGESAGLERLADELRSAGVPTEADLLDGPVVPTLAGFAAGAGADLVVMATHGRGPLSRIVLGGVADALVRRLGVPTVLVRPTETHPGHGRTAPARHLLVALDGSPEAEAVLPAAAELGDAMGARFTLLRVIDDVGDEDYRPTGMLAPCWPLPGDPRLGVEVPNPDAVVTRRCRRAAVAYLERVAAPLRGRGLDVETRVVAHSSPATAIPAEAHDLGCDLIALGFHGRVGVSRLLLGSVADQVVRCGTDPVLTLATTH